MIKVTFNGSVAKDFYTQLRQVMRYPPRDVRPDIRIDEPSNTIEIRNWRGKLDTLGRLFVRTVAKQHDVQPQFEVIS